MGVCVALGEYPIIRYFRPANPPPSHEAAILCSHLARFVQDELDLYAKFHDDFPPASSRPRGNLFILDRSLDLMAPLLHEFTYQAMAHDLLPIHDSVKVTYRTIINQGTAAQEEKDLEISEKDKIWTDNRHRHMKDTIEKLMSEFQRFLDANPHFTRQATQESAGAGLNVIKDMLAGLPEFQQTKEAYALHLGMATESMNKFERHKLPDLASVEQVRGLFMNTVHRLTCKILATGLDEDHKKPKGIADQVIRMLDEPEVIPPDRLRLLMLYVLYRDGIMPADMQKLIAHAQLPPSDQTSITNLELLGALTSRKLKDPRPKSAPLFDKKQINPASDEYSLSRYEPVLQTLLENASAGTLSSDTFPYTKPPLDLGSESAPTVTSLRAAKPTWARSRTNVATENRQRFIVFIAGGATYSEARVCYDSGARMSKEVYMITSHMQTPQLFARQLADLSQDRRRLGLPADLPKKQAPSHLFEPERQAAPQQQPQAQQQRQAPLNAQMASMNLNGRQSQPSAHVMAPQANSSAKLTKEYEGEKKDKKSRLGFIKKF